ncbi:MAG: VWA domain-containing protein, partial [Bryobacteraceae bacterium]
MYMQELGTTLLRNKSVISRVAAGLLLLGMAAAQSTPAPQAQPSAAPANNAPSTPPTQNPQAAPPVTQGNPPQEHGAQGDPPPGPGDQGQAPVGSENGGFVFRAEAREVTLHATVVDDRNHLVNNLDKTDFTVFENDKPQKITHFHQEDFPVAIGIVIDNSGSMREKRDAVNKAALNLVRASNPDDQVFVVNFNDEYYLDQEFTSDIKKLQAALEHVEARGGTALYDA